MNKSFSRQSLIEYGQLTEKDWLLIKPCRGDSNKLGLAYQLIYIRLFNTLIPQSSFEIIEEIVIYAATQLSLDVKRIESYQGNRKKVYEHQQKIIKYLDFKYFDEHAKNLLSEFISTKSLQLDSVSVLQIKAFEFLKESKILLPSTDTMARIIKKQRAIIRKELFDKIHQQVSPEIAQNLDKILKIDNTYSGIERIKRPIKNASVDGILDTINRLENIIQTGVLKVDLSFLNNNYKRTLANEVKRCSAKRMRIMTPTRRYTVMLVFLHQAYQTHLDALLSMYIKVLNFAHTRAKNDVIKQYQHSEEEIRISLENYEKMKTTIQDKSISDEKLRAVLLEKFPDEFNKDLPGIRAFLHGKTQQTFQFFMKKYNYFRQFTPKLFSVLKLQIESTAAQSDTLQAVNLLTNLNEDTKRKLPKDTPIKFVPK